MKKSIVIAAMAGVMTLSAGVNAYAGQWLQTGGVWRYLRDDGSLQADGWQWIDGRCYYFDEAGNMLTGTNTPDGYLVDGSGAWVVDGVVQVKEEDQRQMASMKRASDSQKQEDKDEDEEDDRDEEDDVDFYDEYADEYSNAGPGYHGSGSTGSSGAASAKKDTPDSSESESGWEKVDGEWKYSSGGRYVVNDWLKVDGEWYYFDDDGNMVTGFRTIRHEDYYFKDSGVLQMKSFTLDNVRYTVNGDGAITDEKDLSKGSKSSSSPGSSSKYTSNNGTTFGKESPDDDGPVKQTEFEYSYDERNRRSYDDDEYDEDDENTEDDDETEDEDE